MKNIVKIICLTLFIFQASCSSEKTKEQTTNVDYKPFSISLLDGETLHSDSLAGKVVLVDYWATWCGPCIKEVPGYNDLYKKFKNDNFIFLPICIDSGDAGKIRPFLEEFDIKYPVYVGNSTVRSALGEISALPSTFILDQAGKIKKKYVGFNPIKIDEIDRIVTGLLGGK